MKRLVLALVLPALTLFCAGQAHAWCRTKTCDRLDAPPECGVVSPFQCTEAGMPIAWPNTCVSTSVSAHGSPLRHITADQMRDVVRKAFDQWTTADCGGGKSPSFVVDLFPDVNCTDVTEDSGYKTTGPNYNIWIFRDTDWPYGTIDESAIAITTTQFSPDTGIIYDSDVELNSEGQPFTLGDPPNADMDLWSVVQHEAGHFLGLAHSQSPGATMLPSLGNGDISRRSLEQDDIDGICAAYPPERPLDPACDPEPRHGFSTECVFEKGCCTVAPGRVNRAQRGLESFVVAAFLAMAVARRRRSPIRC